jgi:hypothetical protein
MAASLWPRAQLAQPRERRPPLQLQSRAVLPPLRDVTLQMLAVSQQQPQQKLLLLLEEEEVA